VARAGDFPFAWQILTPFFSSEILAAAVQSWKGSSGASNEIGSGA